MRPNHRPLATTVLAAAMLMLAGCATASGPMVVSPWGAVGVHDFGAGTQRTALARREAPLPTLERPLLSAPVATPVLAAIE